MRRKMILLAAVLAMVAGGPLPAARAACDPGDKVDGTTADDARRKILAAGYTQVTGLTKGCDNFWHGRAVQGGAAVNVLVSPQGKVQQEGD